MGRATSSGPKAYAVKAVLLRTGCTRRGNATHATRRRGLRLLATRKLFV
jgi:hypothetical protein